MSKDLLREEEMYNCVFFISKLKHLDLETQILRNFKLKTEHLTEKLKNNQN